MSSRFPILGFLFQGSSSRVLEFQFRGFSARVRVRVPAFEFQTSRVPEFQGSRVRVPEIKSRGSSQEVHSKGPVPEVTEVKFQM